MIEAGALEGVDYVLGTHVWKDVPSGKVLVLPEAMMAAPDEFSIEIQGRGGHGSLPQQTVDPIWIGAQIINALKTITSSLINPMEHGVVSDHADSHGGTLYGINGRLFFLNAFRLCKKYGLPFRFPRRSDFLRRQFGHEPGGALKAAHRIIVASADTHGVQLIDDFITNPYPVAKIEGYAQLAVYYEREIASAKEGITEVFLHPSLPDETLLKRTPEWQKRVWEYEFLTSDAFDNLLKCEGFVLSSWKNASFGRRKHK